MSCQIKFGLILKSLFHKAHCILIPEKNVTSTVLSHQMSMVSCHTGPTRHAYAWQIGPFWQDTIDVCMVLSCFTLFWFYYLRSVLAFGYCGFLCLCVCLSVCVNHLLVHKITCDLFKLGSPNLDQTCKGPWLRSPLCWKAIDRPWPSRSNLRYKSNFTKFWAWSLSTL